MNSSDVCSLPLYNTTGVCPKFEANLISATVINLLIGLPLNSYMVWIIIAEPVQIVPCFLELNMALCEILFGVLSPCNFVTSYKYKSSTTVYYVSYFSYGILVSGRPLFQTLICVERYMAVVYPVVFLKYRVLRYKLTCSTLGWLIVLTFSLILVVFMKNMDDIWYMLPVQNLILIVVKLFCFSAVLRSLTQPQPGDGKRERERANQAKMRAFKIILFLLVSTVFQYVPLLVVWILQMFLPESKSISSAEDCILCIMVGAGFIQPLLFLQRTGKLPCMKTP